MKKHEENDTKANHSQTAHTSDKEKNLKSSQRIKRHIKYGGRNIRMIADFLSKTMQIKR